MSRSVLSTLDRAAGGLFPYSAALSAEVLEARATVERMAEALAITEPTQAMREAAYAQQAEYMRQLGEHCEGGPAPEDLFVLMWRAAIKAGPYEAALLAYRGEQA